MKPLIESTANPPTRELLRSALSDGPRPGAAQRAALALGVVLTANATSLAASAAVGGSTATVGAGLATAGASQAVTAALVGKWLAIGLAGGALVAGGGVLLQPERPAQNAESRNTIEVQAQTSTEDEASSKFANDARAPGESAPGTRDAPARSEVLAAAEHDAPALPVRDRAAEEPVAEPSPGTGRKATGKLGLEVELIEAARSAVSAANGASALTALETYGRIRETGTLDREARLLRIDALNLLGERRRASELARRYLADFPHDAHATRLRELVQEANQP